MSRTGIRIIRPKRKNKPTLSMAVRWLPVALETYPNTKGPSTDEDFPAIEKTPKYSASLPWGMNLTNSALDAACTVPSPNPATPATIQNADFVSVM